MFATNRLQGLVPYQTLPGEKRQALSLATVSAAVGQLSHTLSRRTLVRTPVPWNSSPPSRACVDCKALFSYTPGDAEKDSLE